MKPSGHDQRREDRGGDDGLGDDGLRALFERPGDEARRFGAEQGHHRNGVAARRPGQKLAPTRIRIHQHEIGRGIGRREGQPPQVDPEPQHHQLATEALGRVTGPVQDESMEPGERGRRAHETIRRLGLAARGRRNSGRRSAR